MEPLSILLKMACGTRGPGWPRGAAHAHVSSFRRRDRHDNFVKEINFGVSRGIIFVIEARQQHCLWCAEQCPIVERDVSTLLLLFYVFFPNSSKSTCSRKTRWHTFLGLFPTSFSYKATPLHNHLVRGPGPVIIFFFETLITIGEITLSNLEKKSNNNFG